jgi:fatty-acyl-CoA synthase
MSQTASQTGVGIFDRDLGRTAANHMALTPLDYLERAATAYPDKIAVIHGDLRRTYGDMYRRTRQLASALAARGLGLGDTVSIMAPNTPGMLEAHYGVPMAGCVLNALNTRLDASAIAFILDHGESKLVLVDKELAPVVEEAVSLSERKPPVIWIDDALAEGGKALGEMEYEDLLATGDPDYDWAWPADEWQAQS